MTGLSTEGTVTEAGMEPMCTHVTTTLKTKPAESGLDESSNADCMRSLVYIECRTVFSS